MNKKSLVVLLNNANSENVKYIQNKLEQKKIYTVHISSGYRVPTPVGLRVKLKDYEQAKKILKSMNYKPYNISNLDKKSALRQFVVLCILGFITIILLILMIIGVFN